MKFFEGIKSAVSKLTQRINNERKDIKSTRQVDVAPTNYEVSKAPKVQNFFYRNAGFNRQELLSIKGEIANPRTPKERKNFLRGVLNITPKNIPYKYGKIPLQHAGLASPPEFIAYQGDRMKLKSEVK